MRALIQRVSEAQVTVDGSVVGRIGPGLLVFVGIAKGDTQAQATQLGRKVINCRVFPDDDPSNGDEASKKKMDRSVLDLGLSLLIVSQFTLYGDTRKGNRPSYSDAARPDVAKELYDFFCEFCRSSGLTVQTGVFQAHMEVTLINDGPVTLMFHSEA